MFIPDTVMFGKKYIFKISYEIVTHELPKFFCFYYKIIYCEGKPRFLWLILSSKPKKLWISSVFILFFQLKSTIELCQVTGAAKVVEILNFLYLQ